MEKNTASHYDAVKVERKKLSMSFLEDVITEYYGRSVWVFLKQYIDNKGVDTADKTELFEAIREFFGGSNEILDILLSRYDSKKTGFQGVNS